MHGSHLVRFNHREPIISRISTNECFTLLWRRVSQVIFSFLNISRTKTDDPEREKLKAKAKEIQRDEAERIRWRPHTCLVSLVFLILIPIFRHEEANRTALEAIGGPKKRKFGEVDSLMGPPQIPVRSRTKRVHLRDVMFLMEQEKRLKHSDLLYRCYFS